MFQSGFLVAQVAASQITSDGQERVMALGRLSTAYTVGMVIGPAVGGWLGASGDYYLGAKLAVLGSLVSIVLSLFININPSKTGNTSTGESKVAKKESNSPSLSLQ